MEIEANVKRLATHQIGLYGISAYERAIAARDRQEYGGSLWHLWNDVAAAVVIITGAWK